MGGFWAGVFTFDAAQGSELFVGITTEDGRFHFISAETSAQLIGSQVDDTTRIMGTGLAYAGPGSIWPDGTTLSDLTTDGLLVEGDSFSGIWSTASGESGNFDLFYDTEYERPASLALLEGVWTAFDDLGNPVATFTIDAQGQFTGQNTSGCVSSGQMSIIDDRYNTYDVASTISNCFIAGDYTGLAAIGDVTTTNDAIVLSISNDARAIVLGLEK